MDSRQSTVLQQYRINGKSFVLKDDFTYKELEWLDVVVGRLEVGSRKSEVQGSFTRDEIEKTLLILFDGFEHEDFMECTEGLAVKIIADFFLQKAALGVIIKNFSMN